MLLTDICPHLASLQELTSLPRPVYGHVDSISNVAVAKPHSHPWAQLSFTLEGVLQINTAEARYLAPPNQAVWIPAGKEHSVKSSAKSQMRSLYIATNPAPLAADACQIIQVTPLLKELISAFSALPEDYDEAGAEGRLVAVLLDQLAAAHQTVFSLPWPADQRLAALCERLFQQPDLNLSLVELGQQQGLSSKTLSRLFVKEVGMTFRQWRQRSRMLKAVAQLGTGQRLTDLALSCGYNSQSAFSAAFKAQLGVSPAKFVQHTRSAIT